MIRPLAEADVAQLAARLAELPLLQRYGRGADGLGRDLRAGLERGDQMLVHDPGEGAGAIVWFLPSGTFGMGGYLRLLAVAPGGEGRGVGSALLRVFEDGAAGWSGHAFLLVSDFNSGAQRFYERHGYVQVGRLPGLVRPDIDELLYWRRLSRR